eukprot:IDg8104t1
MVCDLGPLVVTLQDRSGDVCHAFALLCDGLGRRVIVDHELSLAFPLTTESLASCTDGLGIRGLDEVMAFYPYGKRSRYTDLHPFSALPR